MMVPGFMYMGGFVAINPDNLESYPGSGSRRGGLHEVYPGHHVHNVKSGQHALPHTFRLGMLLVPLPARRYVRNRSMVMIPHTPGIPREALSRQENVVHLQTG